jgi:hypothetical protein
MQSTLNDAVKDTIYIKQHSLLKPCIQHQMIQSTLNDTVYSKWYSLH